MLYIINMKDLEEVACEQPKKLNTIVEDVDDSVDFFNGISEISDSVKRTLYKSMEESIRTEHWSIIQSFSKKCKICFVMNQSPKKLSSLANSQASVSQTAALFKLDRPSSYPISVSIICVPITDRKNAR